MAKKYSGVRESVPERYTDFAEKGNIAAEKFSKRCLKGAKRTFEMGIQCQQINSLACLMSLDNAVFISHSPQGCVGCTSLAVDFYRVGQAHRGVKYIKDPRIIVTNLDQKNIVFSGEEKLRKAVEEAVERYNPKIIFIFSSCASGIIGDDIEAIAADLQKKYEAFIVPIHCEGFKSKICASGFDAAFIAVQKYLMPKEKQERKENLINLFAPTSVSYADQLEMERMLAKLGLETNYFPFYSSIEKIKNIPSAAASTSICKVFADEFMKLLEEEYEIPYSHTVMPIGIRNTDEWYLGIARTVGKEEEVRALIEEEHKKILPLVESIRERLQGKRVFVVGGTGRSFAAAALMEDFGMELVGISTPVYDKDAQNDVEYLNQNNEDYQMLISGQYFEIVNLVNRLKPDVFIGMAGWVAQLGIPAVHVLDSKRPTMGYEGLVYLGNKIADQLENPGFNKKLAAHSKVPFRAQWLNEDPFKYIIKEEN